MVESFRDEHISHEKHHELDGAIEVFYSDGSSITLQTAEARPTSTVLYDERVQYDLLVNSEGYELEPYTIFEDAEILRIGNSLEETISEEGKFALHSKRHILDLGLVAMVADQPGVIRLEFDMYRRFWEDSNDYPLDVRMLIEDEGYDLWIRLESQRQLRGVPEQIIIAKLAYIGSAEDKRTMVPFVKTYDGSMVAEIPEQLTLGHPWLYVGVNKYDFEPENE